MRQDIKKNCFVVSLSVLALLILGVKGCPSKPGDPVIIGQVGNDFGVTNGFYFATISALNGQLTIDSSDVDLHIRDSLVLTTIDHTEPFYSKDFSEVHVSIIDNTDFYIRVRWTAKLSNGYQNVSRTYEFTRSPHVVEQVAVYLTGSSQCGSSGESVSPHMSVNTLTWQVQKQGAGGAINPLASDMIADLPGYHEYGGSCLYKRSPSLSQQFSGTTTLSRSIVAGGRMASSGEYADLARSMGVVAQTVFSVVPEGKGPTYSRELSPCIDYCQAECEAFLIADGKYRANEAQYERLMQEFMACHALTDLEARAKCQARITNALEPYRVARQGLKDTRDAAENVKNACVTLYADLGSGSLSARTAEFYSGFGLHDGTTWNNWNEFEYAKDQVPLKRKYVQDPTADQWLMEDLLIRTSMHLVHRMVVDNGWPRRPDLDGQSTMRVYTPNAKAWPPVAYLWSYLTNGGSQNTAGTDWIYNILNSKLRPYYGTGQASNNNDFEDIIGSGIHYLSYSSHKKVSLGSGTDDTGLLNSHAHALRFAWIMKSAAEMKRNSNDISAWQQIVDRHHDGSKFLYSHSTPARCGGNQYYGLLRYAVWDDYTNHLWYSEITNQAIQDGYSQKGEYEAEFIGAVERACKMVYSTPESRDSTCKDHWCYCPDRLDAARHPFVTRMVRTIPLALVFAYDDVTFSDSPILTADLWEVNAYAARLFQPYGACEGMKHLPMKRVYDPQKGTVILESLRKVIWTNKRFAADWIHPWLIEMEPSAVPLSKRFWAHVDVPSTTPGGTWVAYRLGNRIEIMTNFDGGTARLEFPVKNLGYKESYRDLDSASLRWGSSVPGPSGTVTVPAGSTDLLKLVIQTPIKTKRIITIDIESAEFPQNEYWLFPVCRIKYSKPVRPQWELQEMKVRNISEALKVMQ